MPWEYSDKTRKLFFDAIAGADGSHMGDIPEPDGVGQHGSISCGDAMEFMFRVERNADDARKDRIIEARYKTFGCTSAIASSEALCRLLEEKKLTPIEALTIKNADIVDYLEGLPPQKLHCSVMGAEALQAAVVDWARRRDIDLAELGLIPEQLDEDEGRVVCRCFNLTEPYVRRKVQEMELKTIEDITAAIKAGGACTVCHHEPGGLQDILDDIWGPEAHDGEDADGDIRTRAAKGAARTPFQFAKEVERVIEQDVRARLQADGGDIEIVEIRDKLVYAQLQGVCATCPGSRQTLRFVVEDVLKQKVDPEIRVIEV